MNQQELYDKIQAVNNFRWNQEPIEAENYGTDQTLIVRPSGTWKCITSSFLEDLREQDLRVFVDFEQSGIVVY